MEEFDLVIIGAGPGGYEAAHRASQLGMATCVIEKAQPGGLCVNWGCIPTKALMKSAEVYNLVWNASNYGVIAEGISFDQSMAVKRSRNVVLKSRKGVEYMLRKGGVEVRQGKAMLAGDGAVLITAPDGSGSTVKARDIIVAAGGRNRVIPGLEPDGELVITSREALVLQELPSSLIVVGGGAIGIEFAWYFATVGVKVTVIEMLPGILPAEDSETSEALKRSFEKIGITVLTGARITTLDRHAGGVVAEVVAGDSGSRSIEADLMLVAVGLTGATDELGLETAGVEVEKGFIRTDEYCRTSAAGIYAIGDIRGGMLLAHKASVEGVMAVEAIGGLATKPIDNRFIPRCVYAQPSVASIGLTEASAKDAGLQVVVGRSMFAASGMASASGHLEGFVKLVVDASNGTVAGAHVLGHDAVELIGEIGIICSNGLTVAEVASTVHAHPTRTETVREAAQDALRLLV